MFMKIIFLFLSIFLFLYSFWKRLKEDYPPNLIFTTAFYCFGGVILAYGVSFYFLPTWWFWGSFVGLSLGLTLGIIRFKLKVFEVIEAVVISIYPALSFIFIYDAITYLSVVSLASVLFIIGLIILFYFVDSRYKRFIWYKSGRVGFSGLVVLGIFFSARAVVAVRFVDVLSFVGAAEPFLSTSAALVCFLSVYYLSRKKA